jgi:hypothetical protein
VSGFQANPTSGGADSERERAQNVGFVGFSEGGGARAVMPSTGMSGHRENPTANPTTNPTSQMATAVSGTEIDEWEENF